MTPELQKIFARSKKRTLGIDAFVAEITPTMASALLQYTENVRKPRESVVSKYALDMMRGAWSLTGEPLIYNEDGKGTNGEHRLRACVQADVPFTTLVVTGVPLAADLNVDTGAKRSLGDWLGHRGFQDPKNLAATIRLAYMLLEEGQVSQSASYTNEILLRWFDPKHKGLSDDLAHVRRWEKTWPKGFTRTHAAAVRHVCGCQDISLDRVDGFLAELAYTSTVEVRSPTHQLHQIFVRAAGSERDRIQLPMRLALTIKALNLYLIGAEATGPRALLWRNRDRSEPFPKIGVTAVEEAVRQIEAEATR